ncbi:hypothetical protein M8Q70_002920 [Salmonella enterica]|nr:hypothetical protein [Salmonella enterica]EIV7025260.1 hypothetical protein [Salmonella enterica]EIW3702019.1 hypothetical protein [Salmonella enterica]EJF4885523.1 hypothetical protein [Salmonella enterica]ELX2875571.1 hypothetical protein [Salmonella enterica]
MNYGNNEKLREDVASLSNDMYEMWQRIKQLQREYRYNSEDLADRMAGMVLEVVESEYARAYTKICEMDYQFQD